MKKTLQKKTLLILLAVVVLGSMILGACAMNPAAAPETDGAPAIEQPAGEPADTASAQQDEQSATGEPADAASPQDEQPSNIWQWLLHGLKWLLNTLFDFTKLIGIPSYTVAILLFTIIIKLLLQPLMNKQLRSTRKMTKLQPKLKELQEKYKGNPQKMQEMQMALYKEENISPLGGCLPLLVQMPILIALYNTLRNFTPPIENLPYFTFFWIKDLSLPDPTGIVLAIIVALATFGQQYVSMVNKKDKTQRIMLFAMPVLFAFMTRTFAAGLAIYWIFYSIVSSIIQIIFNHFYAKEEAREEALAAERKAAEEDEKKNNKKNNKNHKGAEPSGEETKYNEADATKKVKDDDHPYSKPIVRDSEYSKPLPLSEEMKAKQAHPVQRKKLKRKK